MANAEGHVARSLYALIAITWTTVQVIPFFTGGYENEIILLANHVGFATSIAFLALDGKARRRSEDEAIPWYDLVFASVCIGCGIYFAFQAGRITTRIQGVDDVFVGDQVFGTLLILVVIEACRRTAGKVLALLAITFIVYAFIGPHLSGPLQHAGMSLERFFDMQVLSNSGVFGTPIAACAHMVFYFILVGAFMDKSGAGRLFIGLAYRITARTQGGAGKASVVASGFFGMVSGSAVANVLLTGVFTIPLMKRSGFPPNMAGALEATSSTGSQLAPPIMGAATFVLASIVGVSYLTVMQAAVIPAALYYLSLLSIVHFYSLRENLLPLDSEAIKDLVSGIHERWHLFLPLVLIIVLLLSGYSIMNVGLKTVVAIFVVGLIRKTTRMGPKAILDAVVQGAKASAEVAIPSAAAGIIVGTLVYSGLALRLQEWLVLVAGNSLLLCLAGSMVLTIIFGMGMPTTAAYLVSAVLVAPALTQLGIPVLAAHMFILYFSVLSMVTPPVALAAYAAAGISGANLWTTGLTAFMLAIPGFLIPYAFVLNPAMLLIGTWDETLWIVITASPGVILFAATAVGYLFRKLSLVERGALFVASIMLIDPNRTTDILGIALTGIAVAFIFWRSNAQHKK